MCNLGKDSPSTGVACLGTGMQLMFALDERGEHGEDTEVWSLRINRKHRCHSSQHGGLTLCNSAPLGPGLSLLILQ